MPISGTVFRIPEKVALAELSARQGNTKFQNLLFDLPFPFPFLLLGFAAFYLLIVAALCILRYILVVRRSSAIPETQEAADDLSPFYLPCSCCTSFAEVCDCCRVTSIEACLVGLCPQRQTHDCADLLFCQACLGRPGRPKKSVPIVHCPTLCQSTYCEDTTLCCFYCEFRTKPKLLEDD